MTPHITQEEVRKVARIAALHVDEADIVQFTHDLNEVITYASGLAEIAALSGREVTPTLAEPFDRPDVAQQTDTAPLVALGHRTENNYFVVPVIVKGAE